LGTEAAAGRTVPDGFGGSFFSSKLLEVSEGGGWRVGGWGGGAGRGGREGRGRRRMAGKKVDIKVELQKAIICCCCFFFFLAC